MRNIHLLLLAGLLITSETTGQEQQKSAIDDLLQTRGYVFYALAVLPLGGGNSQLPSGYFLSVQKDILVADLPYSGRLHSASSARAGNPEVKFTASKFEYSVKVRKKGGGVVRLKPKNVRSVSQLILTVFDNGRADLLILFNDRDSITYSGAIINGSKP